MFVHSGEATQNQCCQNQTRITFATISIYSVGFFKWQYENRRRQFNIRKLTETNGSQVKCRSHLSHASDYLCNEKESAPGDVMYRFYLRFVWYIIQEANLDLFNMLMSSYYLLCRWYHWELKFNRWRIKVKFLCVVFT